MTGSAGDRITFGPDHTFSREASAVQNRTIPSRRRPRGGVRASVLAVGAVGMAASLGVGGLGISALADANATLGEVDDLSAALSAVQDIETSNSDVTGWQASYAWDTSASSPRRCWRSVSPAASCGRLPAWSP